MFDIIAFDADDTLWHNESLFSLTHEKFRNLLMPYHDAAWIDQKLLETERRNLSIFGYGIKGFALSMIETAIELTEGRISGDEIQHILDAAKGMMDAPVVPLDHVIETLKTLSVDRELMIITKGDLFDQESKIARSGLDAYFTKVEIVSEKNEAVYRDLMNRHQLDPSRVMMVGNSLKSDILPMVGLGATCVHIPYHTTWIHEAVDPETAAAHDYHELTSMADLPALVNRLS